MGNGAETSQASNACAGTQESKSASRQGSLVLDVDAAEADPVVSPDELLVPDTAVTNVPSPLASDAKKEEFRRHWNETKQELVHLTEDKAMLMSEVNKMEAWIEHSPKPSKPNTASGQGSLMVDVDAEADPDRLQTTTPLASDAKK